MSYVSTYNRRMPKPKGVGLAIGVHAVVIAAIIAMPGIQHIQQEQRRTEGTLVNLPKPDENIVEPDKPIVKIPPKTTTTNPLPPIDGLPTAPDITPTPFTSDGGDVSFGGGIGNGDGIRFDPPEITDPITEPVFVQPKLNTRYAGQFQPRYPAGLLRLEEEGIVSVKVLVGTNGRAKDIKLLSTPHSDFWESTRKHALRKWRFTPATEDGKPVESWITLKVKFEINS